MCVFRYVFEYVFKHFGLYVCLSACLPVCRSVCLSERVYVSMHLCIYDTCNYFPGTSRFDFRPYILGSVMKLAKSCLGLSRFSVDLLVRRVRKSLPWFFRRQVNIEGRVGNITLDLFSSMQHVIQHVPSQSHK